MKQKSTKNMLSVFAPLLIAVLMLVGSLVLLLQKSSVNQLGPDPSITAEDAGDTEDTAHGASDETGDDAAVAPPGETVSDARKEYPSGDTVIYTPTSYATRGSLILHSLYMSHGALQGVLPEAFRTKDRKVDPDMITGNGTVPSSERTTLTTGFFYEPISDELFEQLKGLSYPEETTIPVKDGKPLISREDLVYLHVFHTDYEGNPSVGEMICNKAIAQDLLDIFYELYKAEYPIEKMVLVDNYGADDERSMADNNSSAFNFRVIAGTDRLSNHSYGLAVDINPLHNPYVTFDKATGEPHIAPEGAEAYADRDAAFPHKINHDDLCYRLFVAHGFDWGGDWTHSKDYQHFDKTP